ncbi:hypothetical protein AVEN_252171-1 [Araneus ventricosus]|uniref:Uncharacterized protein n=1 Tax=Araneus ventricosus TaxID=182803 RepID=A0A4Y2PZ40_ARAVE|nr:hypothetical protein AVEN_252171-1 [Araneus ventricosus]
MKTINQFYSKDPSSGVSRARPRTPPVYEKIDLGCCNDKHSLIEVNPGCQSLARPDPPPMEVRTSLMEGLELHHYYTHRGRVLLTYPAALSVYSAVPRE